MRQVLGLLLCVLTVIVAVATLGLPAAASGTERPRARDLVCRLMTQIGHAAFVKAVAFSPDGASILSESSGRAIGCSVRARARRRPSSDKCGWLVDRSCVDKFRLRRSLPSARLRVRALAVRVDTPAKETYCRHVQTVGTRRRSVATMRGCRGFRS
jgi:hypothetical protein